ncbi:helix-turn-helix domain-containing protein [Dinghuibacter silviterrae]|uniref:AraC family transcriptional regulator n=1 Tax=Dinghuibacter silviterrae TaxID=1539049 RepID=A0A4R8DTZ1_9BACT|nr:helix-turn-helix domain-containing protein [Dinghuibacter silviterrae]TDX01812.1 AraC family transcriptional regulator [Dinghuibacter silviterrae]
MTYLEIPPPPLLAPYVRFFWVLESNFPPGEMYVHRTLASGCPEMVFHYKGSFTEILPSGDQAPSFRSGITGQTTSFNRYAIQENFGIFGAFLYPYGLPALFGVSAQSVSNQSVDLASLCGAEGRILEERILSAPDNPTRVELLSTFLTSRLHPLEAFVIHAIRSVVSREGLVDLAYLADQCFRSRRQFERDFKTYSGFSPKLFARLSRFGGALEPYGDKGLTLTQIAYACGYYDQSHFIHEFKAFSGHHPKEYFGGKAEAAQWKN